MGQTKGRTMSDLEAIGKLIEEVKTSGLSVDGCIAEAELRIKRLRVIRNMEQQDAEPKTRATKKGKAATDGGPK